MAVTILKKKVTEETTVADKKNYSASVIEINRRKLESSFKFSLTPFLAPATHKIFCCR